MNLNKYTEASQKHKAWMKKHPIITGIIFLFLFIFLVSILGKSSNTASTPEETSNTSASQPVSPEQTFEDQLKILAEKTGTTNIVYEEINNEKADNDRPADSRMITVTYNVISFYKEESFFRDTGELTGKVFQEVFASNPTAYDVIVWYKGETTDTYGNKSQNVMLSQAIDKKTFEKINWQNFDSANMCDFLRKEGSLNNGETVCSILANFE